ncbi:hypothetical protein [Cellulomonas sp. URHD0024]|uniref:hypothetical protein n=1 Tax=Cellulomonas sp. URHD0024 TaxID=1302620 RepID=UPI00048493DA|nr:hypothetical protein [Cellulomonas sp. URHD0024]
MSSVRQPDGVVRILGILTMIAGAVFLIAGGVTWGAVSSNLKAEKITVSPDAAHFGGAAVDTPWEAFSQADIIKHHSLKATGGQTYAEVSSQAKALGDKLTADGVSAADQAANPDLAKLNGLKQVVMTGSFLRASLFTSVVAFGVAALVMGIGVVFGLVGYAITRSQKKDAAAVA